MAYTTTEEFLQAVFGNDWRQHARFAGNTLAGGWYERHDIEALDNTGDCYLSIAAFPAGAPRQVSKALEVRCLAIDDVGELIPELAVEMALGTPTAIVSSSAAGNHWWYRLATPVPVADWPGFIAGVAAKLGHKLHGSEAHHVFRLPMGIYSNPKKPDRHGFRPALVELNLGAVFDPAKITPVGPSKAQAPAGGGSGSDIKLGLDDLRTFMSWIPSSLFPGRKEWVDAGHDLKALCKDDEDGFTVFDEWSEPEKQPGYNRTTWDDLGASGLKSTGGMLKGLAEQREPQGFAQMFAAVAFDDAVVHPTVNTASGPGPATKSMLTATPYKWKDPDKLPLREWLYGNILIRKFISMTVAPGGVGKSSLVAVETLAQVTGKNLLGEKPAGELRVWLWNLEDPHEETERKIQAAAKHYGIVEADIGDRLFVDSGRDQRLVIAQMDRTGPMIVRPVVGALVEQIKARGIDVVVIDPFVSCHEVPENDNTAQDMVVKEWGRVAELGGCAVHLVDHTRKSGPGVEVTTESSRGGKAKTDAARVVRVVNRMTETQGKTYGVLGPWRYFNTFNDKANMAPPVDRRDWFFLESVGLGNGTSAAAAFAGGVGAGVVSGDDVGVATRWVPPSPQDMVTGTNWKAMVEAMGDKEWRKDVQAGEKWIGIPAAEACGVLRHSPQDRKAIKEVLETWFKAGLLKEVSQTDENRKTRKFIEIAGGF